MKSLPTRTLREHPDLDQLKRQAKELLEAFIAREPHAIGEIHTHYRDADPIKFALHDAQLVLARAYGFDSWPKLKAHVNGVTVKHLCDTVRAGDIEKVRAMLNVRPELVNMLSDEFGGNTALHYAVLGRMPDMVRVLMEFGANARAGIYPHTNATSAFAISTERGYDEIVAIIRDEEKRRETGRPTVDEVAAELRDALRSGDETQVIAILERRPVLVEWQNPPDRWTLLHGASAMLLERMAIWLLDHGADVNRRAKHDVTPLDVIGKRCDEVDKVARLAPMAELLRARGAELTARSAVILCDAKFLRALHIEGSVTTPLDRDGWLLKLAVEYNRPEILKLLLDFGLDPDARVRVESLEDPKFTWGMPLWHCARYGKHAMAEMLLEHGADPNGQVYASGTPVSEAYGQRDEKMIALLERFGGRSHAAMAGLYRRPDLAHKLLAQEPVDNPPDDGFAGHTVPEQLLGGAACGGEPEILRMALDRIDWPPGDPRWYPILEQPLRLWNHWIGPWCHPEWDRSTYLTCFRLLLERCGPPTGRLRFGLTLLHEVAASREHMTPEERVQFATTLLDAGARTDVRDDLLQSTPLGWACRWGRVELVKLFLERGADPVEADTEPWATPQAWAEKMKHKDVLAVLNNARREVAP